MRRVFALGALLLAGACSELVVGSGPKTDNVAVFDSMWNEVDLRYPYLDYKGIDWKAVGAKYRPLAAAATNDSALANVLSKCLGELQDVHVTLTAGAKTTRPYVAAFERRPTYFDSTITNRLLSQLRATSGGHVQYAMADATAGYLRIASFIGTNWGDEVDEALKGLPNARTLLIDVRDNQGGSRPLAIDAAGRFTRDARTFSYLRFRDGAAHDDFTSDIAQIVTPSGRNGFDGSIQVLANRHTMSAGEDFVLAMRAFPNVTVVGDTTAGATGGPMPRELPNGWTYQISEWIQFTPEHRAFEGIGLAPDVVVQPNLSDIIARRDPTLQRAVVRAASLQ